MNKVLVTGGNGFIGSHFIHYWLKKYPRDTIRNMDLETYASWKFRNLQLEQDEPRYEFVHGDIRNRIDCANAMQDIDIVIHFAAETHVDNAITDSSIFFETNVIGTANLLEEARRAKVNHFHLVSTDEVFGHLDLMTENKFTESTPYNPRNPYSASKAGADHAARAYFMTHGLPVTITNCSNNFGPYQHLEKFIPSVITNALYNKQIPIYGDGLYVRDWLYVEDHCEAIDLVITRGKVGETYVVGGLTEDIPNIKVAERILDMMNKPYSLLHSVKDRPGHDRRYAMDWSKIRRELGWNPKHSFNTGLEKTIDFYSQLSI